MANPKFIRVTGLKELSDKLKKLSGQEMEWALRGATFAGAQVIQQQAQANFITSSAAHEKGKAEATGESMPTVQTGVLRANIIIKRKQESAKTGQETYLLTVRKGKMNGKNDAYYAAWVEFGHHYVPKKPKNKGWKAHREETRGKFVPPHPFMRPAFAMKKAEAIQAIKNKLSEKIKEFTHD